MKTAFFALIALQFLFRIYGADEPSRITFQFSNSIIPVDEPQVVISSGFKPLTIRLKELTNVKSVKLVSDYLHEPLIKETVKGEVELVVPYSGVKNIFKKDNLILYSVDGLNQKQLAKWTVYPVRAQLFGRSPRDTAISFSFKDGAQEKERTTEFSVRVLPWHPALAKNMFLTSIPSRKNDIQYKIVPSIIDAPERNISVIVNAKATAAGALTLMLGKKEWQECAERMRVYISVNDEPLKLPISNEAEIVAITAALDEAYPKPRDERTEKIVEVLRAALQQSNVPELPRVLKLLNDQDLKYLLKDAGEDIQSAIMDLSLIYLTQVASPPEPQPVGP